MFKVSANKLQFIAAVKVGEMLINEAFPNNYCKRPSALLHVKTWNEIRDNIALGLGNLHLPQYLKARVWDAVVLLYHQTRQWADQLFLNNNCEVLFLETHRFSKLFFKSFGQVHRKQLFETHFETMIHKYIETNQSLCCLFITACKLCLETTVNLIWRRMTEEDRDRMLSRNTRGSFVAYWLYQLVPSNHNERMYKLAKWYKFEFSIESNYFSHAMKDCNFTALEYMWNILSEDEKKYRSYQCAEVAVRYRMTNLAFSALNYLNEQDFKQIIHLNAQNVLLTFLHGPYDDFFIQVVEQLWCDISGLLYCDLFRKVVERIPIDMSCAYKSKSLFEDFWEKSPSSSKFHAIRDHANFKFLLKHLDVLETLISPQNFKEVVELLSHRIPT